MPASPFHGIFFNPSDSNHARIRKILSPGFSEKAIRERQDIIQSYVTLLIQKLRERSGNPVDILELFECTGVDVSTRLAFGKSIDALWVTSGFERLLFDCRLTMATERLQKYRKSW